MKRRALILAASLVASLAASLASFGCAALRPITASSEDLADYRAFRVAANEGTRLARAQRYVEAHPQGAWVNDVRAAFDAEEPPFFEASTTTRERTREYLIALPSGPHASAAVALLTAFDRRVEDEASARIVREARRTEATLEHASEQRRLVGETILGWLAALLDPNVYDARIDEAPPLLHRALAGTGHPTWGAIAPRHEADLFFSLPTRPERESRLVTLTLSLKTQSDLVVEGRIEGADLFVRWNEADDMRAKDPTNEADRRAAAAHARDLLAGALEARFPERRCDARDPRDPALIARACDDWSATVRMADSPGGTDAITIRGPHRAPVFSPPRVSPETRPVESGRAGKK